MNFKKILKTYEVEDYYKANIKLLEDSDLIQAESGRKALDIYLKKYAGIKVKVSSSNNVYFKVTPIYVDDNGRRWIDRRSGQRALWYTIIW